MNLKLQFTAQYRQNKQTLRFICRIGDDISGLLANELKKIFPGSNNGLNGKLFIRLEEGRPVLVSEKPVTVNGVSLSERPLKKGDRITAGELRLFYESNELYIPEAEPENCSGTAYEKQNFSLKRHPLRAAAIISFACAAAVAAGCLAIPRGHQSGAVMSPPGQVSRMQVQTAVPAGVPETTERPETPEDGES